MHEGDFIDYTKLKEFFGLDSFYLKSVGITVGSSTSHLMFSELLIRRSDSRLSKFEITERKVIHKSPIIFTPYLGGIEIDTGRLHQFFKEVYTEAGYTPDDVDTGAIIITGYASRKKNAEAILELFSRWAGKFVCATAGPNLESLMAAHGSGAVSLSKETGKTVMNIDIGGGSSKIAVVQAGTVIDTSSVYVGSRIIATDQEKQVTRVEESANQVAEKLGIDLRTGMKLTDDDMKMVAGILTDCLFELIERKGISPLTQKLMETLPIQYNTEIDIIMFSGGVAEYIYGYEKDNFYDLGPYLGEGIKHRMEKLCLLYQQPAERIRATVMGAAQYSVQVSGNTIFLSSNTVLPKRNLKVVKVIIKEKKMTSEQLYKAVQKSLDTYGLDRPQSDHHINVVALDLPSETVPDYAFLRALAEGVVSACAESLDDIVLLLNLDVAKLLGNIIVEDIGFSGDVICLDGIDVGELDYVDIGSEIQYSRTVPVIVKNLVFLK